MNKKKSKNKKQDKQSEKPVPRKRKRSRQKELVEIRLEPLLWITGLYWNIIYILPGFQKQKSRQLF